MNTYWDHSEKERAGFSREEVEAFLNVELMSKGVLKVDAPNLEKEIKVDINKETALYKVECNASSYSNDAVYFKTLEDAEKFLELKPVRLDNEYFSNINTQYYPTDYESLSLQKIEVSSKQEILDKKVMLDKSDSIKTGNENKTRKYNKAMEEVNSALEGLWDDWSNCRERDQKHSKVIETLKEYKELTNDDDMAKTFLLKLYSPHDLEKAQAWFGIEQEVEA